MRICFRCKGEKKADEFYPSCAYCKQCDREYRKEKRVEHKEKRKIQRSAIWKQKNFRECKECGSKFVGKGRARDYCSTKCKIVGNVTKKRNGCWDWKGKINPNGYAETTRYEIEKKDYVHRVSYTIFKGEIPNGLYVCHACDNPKCCNPDHLWLGTAKENMQDAKNKGRLRKSKINEQSL